MAAPKAKAAKAKVPATAAERHKRPCDRIWGSVELSSEPFTVWTVQ